MTRHNPEESEKNLAHPFTQDGVFKLMQLGSQSFEINQLTVHFSRLRVADLTRIAQAIDTGILPDDALEKAATHPASARGYITFLATHSVASQEFLQRCVIAEFRELVNMPIADRRVLDNKYTSTNSVQEGLVLSALTLGLISYNKHPKFGFFDDILTAGREYHLLIAELNSLAHYS